jgi:hypothetical protein
VTDGFALLVTDLLLALDELGPIVTFGGESFRLGETVATPSAFLQMKDHVIDRYKVLYLEGMGKEELAPEGIGKEELPPVRQLEGGGKLGHEASSVHELGRRERERVRGKARALLERWESRHHYKLCFERDLTPSEQSHDNDELIRKAQSRLAAVAGVVATGGDANVHVCVRTIDHGKKSSNPLEGLRFFDRRKDAVGDMARGYSSKELQRGAPVPFHWEHRFLRIFYTSPWRTDEQHAEMCRVEKVVEVALREQLL